VSRVDLDVVEIRIDLAVVQALDPPPICAVLTSDVVHGDVHILGSDTHIGRWDVLLAVVHRQVDAIGHVVHGDVAIGDVLDESSSSSLTLDSRSRIGSIYCDVLKQSIRDASFSIAADTDTV